MSDDLTQIIEGEINIYHFLGLDQNASEKEIKTQYRKKALIYHPDKSTGNEDSFNLLSKIYEILTIPSLKQKYDEIRQIRQNKLARDEKLDEITREFKIELEQAEREHNSAKYGFNTEEAIQKKRRFNNLEKLKEEGLRKRREQEKSIISFSTKKTLPSQYISYKDIQIENLFSLIDSKSPRVIVKWKCKPELVKLFTSDILIEIMQIFGEITHCEISPSKSSRYNEGLVEYKSIQAAERAVQHNYKESAKLWDGTKVRKLASLLRDCKFENSDGISTDIDSQNAELKKLVMKKLIPANFNLNLDSKVAPVLNKLIINEMKEISKPYSI